MSRSSRSGWSARAIASSIERSVHDGRMQPSEALPSVRELAHRLKVSPATVAAAYRLLRARGLTSARGRRGTRVIARPPVPPRPTLSAVPEGAIDLASGNPDPLLLPSLAGALRAIDPEPALYDRAPLLPALAAFARSELEADGIPSSSLTITAGALDAIERALREHLRAGDAVALEDPGYPALHDLAVASGCVPVAVDIDEQGPVPESLQAALHHDCRALIVTARAQNPTGAAVSPSRARELRTLLRRHPDVLLIENDPCGPVAGAPMATVTEDTRQRWVHVRSTAKSLGPDLRAAFVAGDALTINRMEGRYALGPRRVSYLLQRLVLALWSDPSAGRQLARASTIYAQRRDALRAALAARGLESRGSTGLNVWVPLPAEAAAVAALANRGWLVAAGEPYRVRAGPGIRITAAALAVADAERLAADVAAAAATRRPLA
jgi:DNA-binding transcriptional MocR family regulator